MKWGVSTSVVGEGIVMRVVVAARVVAAARIAGEGRVVKWGSNSLLYNR